MLVEMELAKSLLLEVLKIYTFFIPNKREWHSNLTSINASEDTICNYYIFKGVSTRRYYLSLCEDGTTFGIQKR